MRRIQQRSVTALIVLATTAMTHVVPAGAAPQTGSVLAQGCRSHGQIGDGHVDHRTSPVGITVPGGSPVVSVAAGWAHSLAATADGSAWAWGQNLVGQLGDGTRTGRSVPTPVELPAGVSVASVAAGYAHSLALTSTGSVLAWGFNERGQLGYDPSVPADAQLSAIPVALPPGTTVTAVAAGYDHSLALTSTGSLLAWGSNTEGELGDTFMTDRGAPLPVALPNGVIVTAISAGRDISRMLTSSGSVLEWGGGSTTPTPVVLPPGTVVTALATGFDHILALTSTGSVLAWGGNGHGQLGDGTTTAHFQPAPVSLPPGGVVTSVAAGNQFSAASLSDGSLLSWGLNHAGQLANGTTADSPLPVPGSSLAPGALVAGSTHVLSRSTSGSLSGWGANTAGQLGDLATAPLSDPKAIALPGNVVTAAAGRRHSVAVTERGVLAWGTNFAGQLGDGTTTDRPAPTPARIPPGLRITAVAAGLRHTLALTSSGAVLAWGSNSRGELGDGTTSDRVLPVPVSLPPGTTIARIAAGAFHSLALTSTGTVLAWGLNSQVGFGDSSTPLPVPLPRGASASAIAAGWQHSLAVTTTGSVVGWGGNGQGQVGAGIPGQFAAPTLVPLPPGKTAAAVAGGFEHSLALMSDGSVFAWGSNSQGELGTGTIDHGFTPQAVLLPLNERATAIAAGQGYSAAVTSAGALFAWGQSYTGGPDPGTFTVGTLTPLSLPLPPRTKVLSVAAGDCHVLARTAPFPPGPVARFTAAPPIGRAPLTVRFIDRSMRNPASFSWDFGDGSVPSTVKNPVHTFTAAGTFTVTETVTNENGTSQSTRQVTVLPTSQRSGSRTNPRLR